ncbi:hypothetical protein Acsp04_35780 [Actinomadura sp. NBRC 104425]|uniref:hypothetical protein n=1 Tax=Actinomadura sp. NBRC 104425 TaxID=3032204 RepID=UPI0024A10A77|nr:hypothetical protein [Actinomadura sp. NBRC 104425]GLZ13343.1 hypothetical protein Acsp04_35780 [Actinomadura sp. NBRC 104425]
MGGRDNDPEHTEESLARLRDWLHAEAERHEPDRDRIWARIEAAMDRPTETITAGGAHPGDAGGHGLADGADREDGRRGGRHAAEPPHDAKRRWLRAGVASLATASVVGLTSGVFWGFTEGDTGPALPLAGRSSDQPGSPGGTGSAAPTGGTPTDGTASAAPSPPGESESSPPPRRSPSVDAGRTARPAKSPFTASGAVDSASNEHWAQNNVVLRVHEPLHALTVTIRVKLGERVSSAGSWLSLPNGDFRSSVKTTLDAIVYTWTLLPGRTVEPGSYTLAAQYNRTAAHDPGEDVYSVRAAVRDGPSAPAEGHF